MIRRLFDGRFSRRWNWLMVPVTFDPEPKEERDHDKGNDTLFLFGED